MNLWSSRIENAPKENYNQLLYDATVTAEPEHVSQLISLGAVIIPLGNANETALHFAAKNGLHRKLELLTQVVGNVDMKDDDHRTPLYYAAVKGHHQCLIALLNHPNKPAFLLDKALKHAVEGKQSKTVGPLLDYLLDKHGLKKSQRVCCRFIDLAAKNADRDTIDVFLEKGFSINGGEVAKVILQNSFSSGSSIGYKSEPNFTCTENEFKGYTSNPIMEAVKRNDLSFVQWLEKKGAKIDIPIFSSNLNERPPKIISLVDYARKLGHVEIKEYLDSTLASNKSLK